VKIQVTETEAQKLCFEMFQNYPEAGGGMSIRAKEIHYGFRGRVGVDETFVPEKFSFDFLDIETGKKHAVKIADAVRGLRKFLNIKAAGGLPGIDFTPIEGGEFDYDAFTVDAVAQCAIFGEVIYG
jgi:hypothetical protein